MHEMLHYYGVSHGLCPLLQRTGSQTNYFDQWGH